LIHFNRSIGPAVLILQYEPMSTCIYVHCFSRGKTDLAAITADASLLYKCEMVPSVEKAGYQIWPVEIEATTMGLGGIQSTPRGLETVSTPVWRLPAPFLA
jgi:hypothetical protein